MPPDRNRRLELRVPGALVGQLAGEPKIFPGQLQRLGAPLLLEVERALIRRRATEIERLVALLASPISASPSTAACSATLSRAREATKPMAPRGGYAIRQ